MCVYSCIFACDAVNLMVYHAPCSFLCRNLYLLLRKSTKNVPSRAAFFGSDINQLVRRLGLCPRSHWETYSAPQIP